MKTDVAWRAVLLLVFGLLRGAVSDAAAESAMQAGEPSAQGSGAICGICQDDVASAHMIGLKCDSERLVLHQYHAHCLAGVVGNNALQENEALVCPTCRRPMPEEIVTMLRCVGKRERVQVGDEELWEQSDDVGEQDHEDAIREALFYVLFGLAFSLSSAVAIGSVVSGV